eukprot:scaffold35212_cov69-Phaeocystis_antarctica.AAC.6
MRRGRRRTSLLWALLVPSRAWADGRVLLTPSRLTAYTKALSAIPAHARLVALAACPRAPTSRVPWRRRYNLRPARSRALARSQRAAPTVACPRVQRAPSRST